MNSKTDMALIEKTAYPRFTKEILEEETLQKLFDVTEQELRFVRRHSRTGTGNLTLLILLKTHQFLGRPISISNTPKQIHGHLSGQLNLPKDIKPLERSGATKTSLYRYRKAIRGFLNIRSWSKQAEQLITEVIEKAGFTMSDPCDLINVAISTLSENNHELPAYRTLNDIARAVRHSVHQQIYNETAALLKPLQKQLLNDLLIIGSDEIQSDFSRIKEFPGKNTLRQMRLWSQRLNWLYSIIDPVEIIKNIKHTKVRQFAAQARQLELGDIKDIGNPSKQQTFLLCLLHEAQMNTRDELINMFLKRMRQTHNRAKQQLEKLKAEHRHWEEQMMVALNQVVGCASEEQKDRILGKKVRTILDHHGGVDFLDNRFKLVSAYHGKNHLPLLWDKHKAHRKALYELLNLLDIESATEDTDLLMAYRFIEQHQNTRKEFLPNEIQLDFLSTRWKAFVRTKENKITVLKRRELEVCVLSYLADAIRCGDLYVNGSEQFADFRKQLLPWEDCLTYLDEYCHGVGLPNTADEFIKHLQDNLRTASRRADDLFPENSQFTIDKNGRPHLKQIKAQVKPEGFKGFKKRIRQLMPERHLLDMLKNVQHWSAFVQHFSPPSGAKAKMNDANTRYLYTVFGYGCNLGAAQTAKHIKGDISLRILKRINDQHITPEKLQKASTNIINTYADFDLPFLWGTGKSAGADGTHIQLLQNNLIGEQHIRYEGYGGIAYHHISDTYIALFCSFIACGIWEAVYILDGLMKNTSKLQPDTVHADTQGQSEPVFGLSYLLGIKLMPRMRNWDDVKFYRVEDLDTYQHIDQLFSDTIDWELIKTHWKDLMRVVISINQGKVLPSMLLQKLGTNSKKNKIYKAFRELGRVIRTIFLLQYINSNEMRGKIRAVTNKVESFHSFHDWITFGGLTITTGDPIEQQKRNKYIDLVANAIMLHNVIDLTKISNQLISKGEEISPELLSFLSPYMTDHIKRFGLYLLDYNDRPEPLKSMKLNFGPVA